MAKLYGVSLLRSALRPFLDVENRIDFENLKILFRSLELSFDL
jgi:hypothetical protein